MKRRNNHRLTVRSAIVLGILVTLSQIAGCTTVVGMGDDVAESGEALDGLATGAADAD